VVLFLSKTNLYKTKNISADPEHFAAKERHVNVCCRSDASNMHDEEPAEDEVEYSDDEAEAEAKQKIKQRKRGEHNASYGTDCP
jgi:hypothetical protein